MVIKMESNKNSVIIKPLRGRSDPKIGPDVIMVMPPRDLAELTHRTNATRLDHAEKDYYDIYRFYYKGKGPIYAMGPFLGAPHAVIGLEKGIVLGGRRIWVLGYCGSLQPHIRIGDFILPDYAYSEEGTSHHYPLGIEGHTFVNQFMIESLINTLRKTERAFVRGTVWTTDAPYRETIEKVKRYKRRGVMGVEMEMSALICVAVFRSVMLAGILVVSDELFEMKWKSGFGDPSLKESASTAMDVILETIISLK